MIGSNPASASAGEATVLADKTIYQSKSSTQKDVLHLNIIDLGGKKSIGSGVVAYMSFSILPGAPAGSYTFSLVVNATDSSGSVKTVEVTNPAVSYTL